MRKASIYGIAVFSLLAVLCLILAAACENPIMQGILELKVVSFETNGGSSIPSQRLLKGQVLTRPDDPVKADFIFDGWYEDNGTFERKWDFNDSPTEDLTLYAKWIDEYIPITHAAVAVTAPVTDQIPDTTAQGDGNFSVGAVTWTPEHSSFHPDLRYTASVTLTADDGYLFIGLTDAEINGYEAEVSGNTGSTVTLSLTFEATEAKHVPVTGIAVETPPAKLEYNAGETLDLSGLIVLVTYGDGTSYPVTFGTDEFESIGLEASPAHGTILKEEHDNTQIIVMLVDYTDTTGPLTVHPAHTVTFVLNNGATPAEVTRQVPHGGTIQSVQINPVKTADAYLYATDRIAVPGFTFQRWYTNSTLTTAYSPSTPVTGDITLYAGYTGAIDIPSTTAGDNDFERAIAYFNGMTQGTYTLFVCKNVSIAPQTLIASVAGSATLTLIIQGYGDERTIQPSGAAPLFTINPTIPTLGTFQLTLGNNITLQGRENATDSLVSVTRGTLIMQTGSKITGNKTNANVNGGAVNIATGGTFIMSGGEISGNTAGSSGGGVYNGGSFTMNGGTITGNTATGGNGGGGIVNSGNGTFTMNGGIITKNTSGVNGGGVSNYNKFTMNGGTISENKSSGTDSKGGGVYNSHNDTGTFTMTGGEINGNSATSDGGGVYIKEGTFNMTGGRISGNAAGTSANGGGVYFSSGTFMVGGTAKIINNTGDHGANNAHLFADTTSRSISINGGGNAPVTSTGGMEIHVSLNEWGEPHNGIIVQNGASPEIAKCFYADAFGKGVGYRETSGAGQLYISAVDTVSAIGGSFQMGQNGNGSTGNVTPVRTVTLTQGFSMSKYQVTQAQYQAVMGGTNPSNSHGVGDNYPVYYVSWYDAIVFCNKLSILEGLTPAYRMERDGAYEFTTNPDLWGTVPASDRDARWDAVEIVAGSTGYRLPTEAQWEFAAKGGALASSPYKIYSGSDTVDDVAWYGEGNTSTHLVGTKAPNELGLYDMSGNVWEWCWDWFYNYPTTSQTDPMGATSEATGNRVVRGGGYRQSTTEVSSVSRGGTLGPHSNWDDVGFRVVRPAQ